MPLSLGPLWSFLFPARCLGCGVRDEVVCPACQATIVPLPRGICLRCARPEPGGTFCRPCLGRPSALATLVAATSYQGIVRQALLELKFHQRRYLAPFLASLLARAVAAHRVQADVLVPVPLSPKRQRQRGYNQSALLAAELLRLDPLGGAELRPEVLWRQRETRPQVGRGAPERVANVQGAFACATPDLVAGRRVAVLDDVCTTGATLEACATALRLAGATRVTGLVVARDL